MLLNEVDHIVIDDHRWYACVVGGSSQFWGPHCRGLLRRDNTRKIRHGSTLLPLLICLTV